jgi:hypothetical protein
VYPQSSHLSDLLLSFNSRSSFLLNYHRHIPSRGRIYRMPRGPFCQLCLQRGHPLIRCPLREGLMFLGHVSMMLQLPNETERISTPWENTNNRPDWRRRRRWLNASRRRRERVTRRGNTVDLNLQLYIEVGLIYASTIMPAVATMQLSSLCHLRLPHRIHGKHLIWHAYGSIDDKAKSAISMAGNASVITVG